MRIKTTHKDPVTQQGKNFDKNYKKEIFKTAPEMYPKLMEVDNMLNEKEQSLKKKIFSLAKMEALVFSDPVLSAKYEEMAENGRSGQDIDTLEALWTEAKRSLDQDADKRL